MADDLRKHVPIEETSVFKKFEAIAQELWFIVDEFPSLAKWTIGKQIADAADSVGFNLVEGDGRYSDSEAIHFFYIARGSARETKLGINRSIQRRLMDESVGHRLLAEIDKATIELNGLISYRKRTRNVRAVHVESAEYNVSLDKGSV